MSFHECKYFILSNNTKLLSFMPSCHCIMKKINAGFGSWGSKNKAIMKRKRYFIRICV